MLLVLDNYDSFTYNLVQAFGALGAEPVVHRNDALSVDAALDLGPTAIVISPGPGTPAEAGISVPLARAAGERGIPLLGVCLGHQALVAAFDGQVVRAPQLMHGKTCTISHDGTGVFLGLPSPLTVMRYHSLVAEPATLPRQLVRTASASETVMAVSHRAAPLHGVQFHPESIGTEHGDALLANFLELAYARRGGKMPPGADIPQ